MGDRGSGKCGAGSRERGGSGSGDRPGNLSTRPVELSPALAAAVERARVALEASGELRPRPGGDVSDFDDETRDVIATILTDGTYRRLADAVAAEDPDVADL